MNTNQNFRSIFLTDDDIDDCSLFSEALQQIESDSKLVITNDGIELMLELDSTVPPPPRVIFLDLNMPRKNGFECLQEIRKTPKLKDIPVVIFSTSSNKDIIDRTYNEGANYYVCKPTSFSLLKKAIANILAFDSQQLQSQPLREKFVINSA